MSIFGIGVETILLIILIIYLIGQQAPMEMIGHNNFNLAYCLTAMFGWIMFERGISENAFAKARVGR